MEGLIFKLKKDKIETWKEWCFCLANERKEEALQTLQEENLLLEFSCAFKINGEWYAGIFTKGEGKKANMEKEINQIHKAKKMECFESKYPIDTLYTLENK